MKSNLKLTLVSICIGLLISSNSFGAIQGYKTKETKEIAKKEDSSLWFFKGYKTDEQKNTEDQFQNAIPVKDDFPKNQTNKEIEKDHTIKDQFQNAVQVDLSLLSNGNLNSVDNIEIIKPKTITHVVNEGETLWNLSKKYYNNSELWTKILEDNPNINNPEKLHKGQEITIYNIDTNFKSNNYTKIKINPYLINHILYDVIITNNESEFSHKIITSENQQRLIKLKDKFFISKEDIKLNKLYTVYRYNKDIENLGKEYVQVGEAKSSQFINNLALMKTTKVKDYLLKDDILIEKEFDIKQSFNKINDIKNESEGEILSVVNNKINAELFDLIILSLTSESVNSGAVLSVYSKPLVIIDEEKGIKSIVPSKEIAEAIVVKSENNFSLAIISKSIDKVNVGDKIK
jgi:hypothetical protein